MPRKRFTNEQIAFALRQAESGATVDEVCRKMGVSEPTFYRWKKQFVGMSARYLATITTSEGSAALTRCSVPFGITEQSPGWRFLEDPST
jgi:AraC-like DNA-binding protein